MAVWGSFLLGGIVVTVIVGVRAEAEEPDTEIDLGSLEANGTVEPAWVRNDGETTLLAFIDKEGEKVYAVETNIIEAAGANPGFRQNIFQCLINGGEVRRRQRTGFKFKCIGKTVITTTTPQPTTTRATTTTTVATTTQKSSTDGNYENNIIEEEEERAPAADNVPDFPINGYPIVKACADVVFVFDGSCSVKKKYKDAGIKVVQAIGNSLVLNNENGAGVGAIVYDGVVTQHIDFNFGDEVEGSETFSERFGKLDTTPSVCRTKTWIAFRYTNKRFFSGTNDRSDDKFKDLMVVLGDGRTAPVTRRKDTIKQAKALRANNVTVAYIQMPHKVDSKTEESLENEIKEITDTDKIFDILNPSGAISGILDILKDPTYSCTAI